MKHTTGYVLVLIVLTLVSAVLGQTTGKAPSVKGQSTTKSLNISSQNFLGVNEGQVYSNKYFRLRLTAPDGWLVQQREVGIAIKNLGKRTVTGKSAQMQKALNDASSRVTVLLTVSKDIMGMPNNSTLILSAEKTPPLLQVRNGRDYLRFNIETFKKVKLPEDFKYSENIEAEKFGTETLYYLQITRSFGSQRVYAFARNGYALFFTLTYTSDEELDTLRNIFATADLSWKG